MLKYLIIHSQPTVGIIFLNYYYIKGRFIKKNMHKHICIIHISTMCFIRVHFILENKPSYFIKVKWYYCVSIESRCIQLFARFNP